MSFIPPRNDNIPVIATSGEVLQDSIARGGRKLFFFRNTSPNAADVITLSFGPRAAIANSGVVLRQNDVYVEADGEGFECWQGAIQGICATANGTLAIMEREK